MANILPIILKNLIRNDNFFKKVFHIVSPSYFIKYSDSKFCTHLLL